MAARISWFTSREVLINFCLPIITCPTSITIRTYPYGAACSYMQNLLTIHKYLYGAACKYSRKILSFSFDWQTPKTLAFFEYYRGAQRLSRLFHMF